MTTEYEERDVTITLIVVGCVVVMVSYRLVVCSEEK